MTLPRVLRYCFWEILQTDYLAFCILSPNSNFHVSNQWWGLLVSQTLQTCEKKGHAPHHEVKRQALLPESAFLFWICNQSSPLYRLLMFQCLLSQYIHIREA